MPGHQGQQLQHNKGNDTSATAQTHQLDRGNNAGATTVVTLAQSDGKEVSAIRTMTSAQ
jgi:hypothetical protein